MNWIILDLEMIAVATILGMAGNVLYRHNRKLELKPMIVRLLFGLMSAVLYIYFHIYHLKMDPPKDLLRVTGVFFIGYFSELVLDFIEMRIGKILERIFPSDKK